MTSDETQQILDDAAAKLGEHFSTVLILASKTDADGVGNYTEGLTAATGDFYARQGLAMAYVEKYRAEILARMMKQEEE